MISYKTSLLRGVSLGILSLLVLVASASAQGPLYTFRADGNSASVYRFELTASGSKSVSVSVNVGGTAENPSAFLYYSSTEQSNGVYTTEYGYGAIPNSSVTTYGEAQHLTLNIDVNTVPDFRIFRSVYVIPCCPAGSSGIHPADGVIALSWDKTSDRWTRYEGHSMTQLYDLILHSQGTSAYFSATAQGSIFGQDIAVAGSPTPYATIGTNRNVYMAVEPGQ
jgi:hypothetical protein